MYQFKYTTTSPDNSEMTWVSSYPRIKSLDVAREYLKNKADEYALNMTPTGMITLKPFSAEVMPANYFEDGRVRIDILSVPEFELVKQSKGRYLILDGRYMLDRNYNGDYQLLVRVVNTDKLTRYLRCFMTKGELCVICSNFWEIRRFCKEHWGNLWGLYETYKDLSIEINYPNGMRD